MGIPTTETAAHLHVLQSNQAIVAIARLQPQQINVFHVQQGIKLSILVEEYLAVKQYEETAKRQALNNEMMETLSTEMADQATD